MTRCLGGLTDSISWIQLSLGVSKIKMVRGEWEGVPLRGFMRSGKVEVPIRMH